MEKQLVEKILGKVPVKSPLLVLQGLADSLKQRKTDSLETRPLITILLHAGHRVFGRLVAGMGDKDGVWNFIVAEYAPQTNLPGQLAYVMGSSVLAVSVHDFGAQIEVLTGGAVSLRMGEAALSSLELKRILAQLNATLADSHKIPTTVAVSWETFPAEEENLNLAYLNLRDVLGQLEESMAVIVQDKLGLESLQTISAIIISHKSSEKMALFKQGTGIILEMDFTRALSGRLATDFEDGLSKIL